ncbi:GAF domain-containing protein [Gordoniibacillus kamchatkensis]|uniref:GAF domain-containing protein n=1 Tax=Gordoniibacillus kamchatkensis TaxID=1590651 RepID=UPI000697B06A|nr:GAF domain-containing protein [Paenibacillus sp. VKM B-2647]
MDGCAAAMVAELDRLRLETGSDFAAFAVPLEGEASWRWSCASGNLNSRYKGLVIKSGRGIAGSALRTGRAVVLGRHRYASDLRKDDLPLLSAERLEAAAAVPVTVPAAGGSKGVLLVGARSPRDYDAASVEKLCESAQRITDSLSPSDGNPSVS